NPIANRSAANNAVAPISIPTETDSALANSPKESATSESIVFVSLPPQTSTGSTSAGKAPLQPSDPNPQVDTGTHLNAVDFALGLPIDHRDRHLRFGGQSGRRTSDALDELFASWR